MKDRKYDQQTTIMEMDVYTFLYDYRWEGSAYVRGIDTRTKIERLEYTIRLLKEEDNQLHEEITMLQLRLGISPFD